MDLISIIVPIYKVELYLKRCIDSIIKQSYENFELILVDDGSPDNCPAICDEYEIKEKRVKVIHKNNGGLSDARNAGLAVATGEYIVFVDSDDWVTPNYLEALLRGIKKSGADICECGVVYTKGESELSEIIDETVNSYSTEKGLKLLIEDKVFHQYVWNKIYRRAIIQNIVFPKGKTNEDEFWTYQIFGNAKSIARIQAPLYYYFQRNDSIMGEGYSLKRLDALEAKVQRKEYMEKYFPSLVRVSKQNLFGTCIYAGQMSQVHLSEDQREMAKRIIDSVVQQCGISLSDCLLVEGRNRVWFTLAYFSFWNTCRIKNFLKKGF